MSDENVEVFKRAFDAINRRDAEALLPELDPEVEWHSAILMGMGGKQTVYRGHEGVREWLRDLYETLSEFHADYPDIRDLGDQTVAIGRIRARGTASKAELESPHGTVVDFKNGKGIRIRTYLDPQEALEAAGLLERMSTLTSEGARRAERLADTSTLSLKGAEEIIREQERAETRKT